MARIEFDFRQPYDEFVVNGEEYTVYYDDQSLKQYENEALDLYDRSKEAQDVDVSNMSDEERKAYEQEQRETIKQFIEVFFGEGSFKKLYEASGKSLLNLMTISDKLLEWLNEKLEKSQSDKASYYTQK